MTQMNSRFRYMYDANPLIQLRPRGQAPMTVVGSTDTAVLPLDLSTGYWTNGGELADQGFAVVANVLAAKSSVGDETYKLDLVSTGGAVIATTKVKAAGQYILFVDVRTAHQADPTLNSIKLTATLAGTLPSLDFFAWLGKHLDD